MSPPAVAHERTNSPGPPAYSTGRGVAPSPTWDGPRGADAALYESRGDGATPRPVEYAGGPGEFVLSWATAGGDIYAGTTAGQVLQRTDDGWLGVGGVPSGIASLSAVE